MNRRSRTRLKNGKQRIVSQLAEKYPDTIVIPIPSMETADKRPNVIPMAYAREYEKAELKI